MKVEIVINEKSIENIIEYVKTHPKDMQELMKIFGDLLLESMMSRKILKKGADLYRAFNGEVNYAYKTEETKHKT